ncbi:ABC transporter substrate-binding protein [Paeniglutamicibacter antarcticus]|uniref:ABC transporter substrate-binding protein n=1 Tax=Arthrobacter terrae TaxID=2935737 RepID=A0A931CQA9_9MICC|nr:ABC transporter substrate-binding protein [Arthrobacter terrae]MBG0741077.1 ABC transporter substrate-binding protein [Arthrobacter terrae]
MIQIYTRTAKLASAKFAALGIVICLATAGCTSASQSGAGAPSGPGSFSADSVPKDENLASMLPANIKAKGALDIGTGTGYAPAEFTGGNDGQTSMGYGIDFGKAIAATLGLEAKFHVAAFPSILPGLGAKYDVAIASLGITPERLQAVNMVSYFNAGVLWAVQKGNPKHFSMDDVCGKTVGVQTGTIEEEPDLTNRSKACVDAGNAPINVISLKTQADVTTRLTNGGVDAMLADSPITYYAISQTGQQLEPLGDVYDAAIQGIAVAKSDVDMANLVAKVINKLIKDGDYKKILDTWNNAPGGITEAVVNPKPGA